jgi:hypothetical protein
MNRYKRFEANGHFTQSYSIGFDLNSSGNLLASGSVNGCVYVYESQSRKLQTKIDVFSRKDASTAVLCMDAKFKYDSVKNKEILAVSGASGSIKIFEI